MLSSTFRFTSLNFTHNYIFVSAQPLLGKTPSECSDDTELTHTAQNRTEWTEEVQWLSKLNLTLNWITIITISRCRPHVWCLSPVRFLANRSSIWVSNSLRTFLFILGHHLLFLVTLSSASLPDTWRPASGNCCHCNVHHSPVLLSYFSTHHSYNDWMIIEWKYF